MKGMILLITPSARIKECAQSLESATSLAVHTAISLQEAGSRLREQEYAAVIVDQFLLEADPDESEQILQHIETAVPVYLNFAITGIPRVVRETRTALARRHREEKVARQSAERAVWNELKEDVTAMLLACDLALAVPNVPTPAVEKLRSVHDLAFHIRERLAASQ
jgi:DNA-binding NtrC family response regulator